MVNGIDYSGLTRNSVISLIPDSFSYTYNIGRKSAHNLTNLKLTPSGSSYTEAWGGSGMDTLYGNAGNNIMGAGSGNDFIDGGLGFDTAVYFEARDKLDIIKMPDFPSTYIVTGSSSGTDTINNIEKIKCLDALIDLDLSGTSAKLYRMYDILYDTAPEQAELGFWVFMADTGIMTFNDVAAAFIDNARFQEKYGTSLSDAGFVSVLYQNMLNRSENLPAYNDVVQGLASGTVTRAELVSIFAESAVNQEIVNPLIENGVTYKEYNHNEPSVWTDTLQNVQIKNTIIKAIENNSLGYSEMLTLFQEVAKEGITGSEFTDLQTIYTNGLELFETDYLSYITNSIIYGNPANDHWTGGEPETVAIGNMISGTTEENVTMLIDKWFLGKDLPEAVITVDGTTVSVSYQTVSGQLFVDGPSASDINQGRVGDCYFMASLGVIANSNPSLIADSFVDNHNGTYGVRFYIDGSPVYTTVNTQLPINNDSRVFATSSRDSADGELWVSLYEKAFIQMDQQADIHFMFDSWNRTNSYSNANGGYGSPLNQIANLDYDYVVNQPTELYLPDPTQMSLRYEPGQTEAKQLIINALEQGSAIWLASFDNTFDAVNGKKNLVSSHAFMLLGYNNATDGFIIRNPWGGSDNDVYNPQFEASIEEFWNDMVSPVIAISEPLALAGNSNTSLNWII